MSIYFEKGDIVLLHGENPSQLLELPNSFVDTIITDPPYGLSFMGKKWDYDVPSIEIWKECLRILKPGGTALIFAGSRTQHRMACNVEDAGFILKDCIMWLYGSGFPKATDLSLQFDKKACQDQLTKRLGRVPTKKEFKEAWDIFRKVVRMRTDGNKGGGAKTFDDDNYVWDKPFAETLPCTPEAILWNGWKSHGLKPAYEPILVAMKPNDGTYANNALVHGVSGLNIAGGMIPYESEKDKASATPQGKCTSKEIAAIGAEPDAGRDLERVDFNRPEQKGRFPANIILDEETGRMLDEQSGISKSSVSKNVTRQKRNSSGVFDNKNCGLQNGSTDTEGFADKGGASRFFYCAKASKKERNAGCEGLQEKELGHNRFDKCRVCGGYIFQNQNRASACKCDNPQRQNNKVKGNHHPTVKPLALMEYLCKLTATPTGGTILDPFMGSGTTGVVSKILGRPFIGIDQDEDSCVIAKARIIHAE